MSEEVGNPDCRRQWGQGRWLLLLLALSAAVWWTSFYGDFIFDDYHAILKNKALPSLPDVVSNTARPLTRLTLWMNYQISGKEIWSYHLFNVLAHLAAGAMLFTLLMRTITHSRPLQAWRRNAGAFSFFVTLAWMVHPMQTEVVTYTIQRAETLSFIFLFWMLYALARAADASAPGRATLWRLSVLVAFGLGALSKETMLVAPLAAALYDRIFWQDSARTMLRRGWLVWGVFALGLLGAIAEWQTAVHLLERGTQNAKCGPWEYFLTQCKLLPDYLGLFWYPGGLCIDHLKPVVTDIHDVIPQIALVVVLLGLTLVALVRWPVIGFCLAWFFIMSAMRSSVIPRGTTFVEHRFLLPAIPLLLLVLSLPFRVKDRMAAGSKMAWLAAVWLIPLLWIALLSARTMVRNRDYADPAAMWEHVLALYPDNPRAHLMIGRAYMNEGRYPEAEAHLRHTLELGEDCRAQFGAVLLGQGKLEEAARQFEHVLQADRENAKTWVLLGNVRKLQHRPQEEERCYRMALFFDPKDAMVGMAMADWLSRQGREGQARQFYEAAVANDPDSLELHFAYAQWLLKNKRADEARQQFLLAAEAKNLIGIKALYQLGVLSAKAGDHAAAAGWFENMARRDPGNATAWYLLGTAQIQRKQYAEAIPALERAVKLRPDHADTHYNLGLCYERNGQMDKARQQLALYQTLRPTATSASQ